MTKLLLVRHGESEANEIDVFIGHTDLNLTERGCTQARMTADFIAETYHVDRIYGSDLKRAFRTGQFIAERLGMPITKDAGLREIYAGEWETRTFDDLEIEYAEDYDLWKRDIGNSFCTGGESVRHLAERILAAFEEIARRHDGETVVLATHATPIRAMLTLMSGKTLNDMRLTPWPTNASVTEVTYNAGVWQVIKASQDAHLKEMKTFVADNV